MLLSERKKYTKEPRNGKDGKRCVVVKKPTKTELRSRFKSRGTCIEGNSTHPCQYTKKKLVMILTTNSVEENHSCGAINVIV
jgi:hypothetical protein